MIEAIRQQVAQAFADMGLAEPKDFRETILIRGGNYCGRRFEGSTGHAIWFVEENQLKFYDADGKLACVLEPQAKPIAARFAA
jgi:hypothetical protein